MIRISNISFEYSESNKIFENFSLLIPDGQIITIIGNSGCGKSTLLNLIAGVLAPTMGTITNTDSISYLMQDITLLPYKTTLENALLAYILQNGHLDIQTRKQAIDLLHLFNIDDSALMKYPDELSGGMRQRVGLVQILLTNRKVLLLDEPFNAIDTSTIESIQTYLWNLVRQDKRTLILITHNIEQALQLSDLILIIRNHNAFNHITPSDSFTHLSPAERPMTNEFKQLFFKVLEKMRQ